MSKPTNLNKSFSRRRYKSISKTSIQNMNFMEIRYKFSREKFKKISKERVVFIEIGIGTGEHIINQMKNNSEALFIVIDVFVNGIIKFLKMATQYSLTNFLFWNDDFDIVIHQIPDNSIEGVYILFPDPWPKNSQKKRRLINKTRIEILRHKMTEKSFLIFVSDCRDYFLDTYNLFNGLKYFLIEDYGNQFTGFKNYIITKYHKKALQKNKEIYFLFTKMLSYNFQKKINS